MAVMVFKNIIFEGKRVKRGVIRPKNRFNYSTLINVSACSQKLLILTRII